MAFTQKYEKLSKAEIETLYREALSGNPKHISNDEFMILEAQKDFRFRDYPATSETTYIKDHHDIHGQNHLYRKSSKKIDGPTESDFSIEELKQLKEENSKRWKEIWKNTENNKNYKQMLAYDAEMAALPPLEKDCIFHRGIETKFVSGWINRKVGDVVKPDKGYAYYAFGRDLASKYGGGAILTVHTPKGARISRNLEHGGEALFPRNAEYKILSKGQTPSGDWRIELEYLLP